MLEEAVEGEISTEGVSEMLMCWQCEKKYREIVGFELICDGKEKQSRMTFGFLCSECIGRLHSDDDEEDV